jgi:hypothetical protein
MDERIAYDDDFYAWSQRQAAVLRELATRPDLPNELDIEHVAEEIEDVGTAELNSVRSFLRNLLAHLIKAASSSKPEPVNHWLDEAANFHIEFFTRYSKSMRQRIDLQETWDLARRLAEVSLRKHGEQLAPNLPHECPFAIEELVSRTFDQDAAVERLRAPGNPAQAANEEGRP